MTGAGCKDQPAELACRCRVGNDLTARLGPKADELKDHHAGDV
jgi:hypothetical protein